HGGAEVAGLFAAEERRVPVFANEFARWFGRTDPARQAQNNPARPDNTHEQRPRDNADSPSPLVGEGWGGGVLHSAIESITPTPALPHKRGGRNDRLTLLPFAARRPMAVFAAGEPR